MKKLIAGAAAAATIAGGSAVIAITNPLGLAGANQVAVQAGGQSTPGSSVPNPSGGAPGAPGAPGGHRGPGRGEVLNGILDDLVKDGTITQDQADKIKAKVKEKMATMGPKDDGGHGPGRMGPMIGQSLDEVAKVLGMTADEVKAGFKDGKTIADLAKAKGIDVQKVIDDLVAAATKKIDEAVAGGKLPADRADKVKAELKDHITRFVNEGPKGRPGGPGGRGPGGPGGRGPGGPSTGLPGGAPSTTAPAGK